MILRWLGVFRKKKKGWGWGMNSEWECVNVGEIASRSDDTLTAVNEGKDQGEKVLLKSYPSMTHFSIGTPYSCSQTHPQDTHSLLSLSCSPIPLGLDPLCVYRPVFNKYLKVIEQNGLQCFRLLGPHWTMTTLFFLHPLKPYHSTFFLITLHKWLPYLLLNPHFHCLLDTVPGCFILKSAFFPVRG